MTTATTSTGTDTIIDELEQFTTNEIEHHVTISCERQRQAEADLKIHKDAYGDIIKAERETRERLLSHLKARKDADIIVSNTITTRNDDANAKPSPI